MKWALLLVAAALLGGCVVAPAYEPGYYYGPGYYSGGGVYYSPGYYGYRRGWRGSNH